MCKLAPDATKWNLSCGAFVSINLGSVRRRHEVLLLPSSSSQHLSLQYAARAQSRADILRFPQGASATPQLSFTQGKAAPAPTSVATNPRLCDGPQREEASAQLATMDGARRRSSEASYAGGEVAIIQVESGRSEKGRIDARGWQCSLRSRKNACAPAVVRTTG